MAMRSPSAGARAARSTTRIEPPCSRPPRPTIATSAATAGSSAGSSSRPRVSGPARPRLRHRLRPRRADEPSSSPSWARRTSRRRSRPRRSRKRARSAPAPTCEIAAAEDLPFADDAFDVTLSQLVVNFMRDAHQGLSEMVRVTRPGGTRRGRGVGLRRRDDAAAALLGHRDRARPGRDRQGRGADMRFATPHGARRAVVERLQDVHVTDAVASADYEGFEDLWAPFAKGVGPGRRVRRSTLGRPRAVQGRVPPPARRRRRAVHAHRPRLDRVDRDYTTSKCMKSLAPV